MGSSEFDLISGVKWASLAPSILPEFKEQLTRSQWARTVGQAILGIFLGIGHTECHFIGFTCVKFTF